MNKKFEVGDKVRARRRVDMNGYTFEGAKGEIVAVEPGGVQVSFVSGITIWVIRKDIRHEKEGK